MRWSRYNGCNIDMMAAKFTRKLHQPSPHILSLIILIITISNAQSLSKIHEVVPIWKNQQHINRHRFKIKRKSNGNLRPSRLKHVQKTAFSLPPLVGDTGFLSNILTQLVSASITYFSFITYYDRPRGELFVPNDTLIIQPSQITAAGLGLYTTRPLKMGTVLGTYPGVIRPTKNFMKKFKQYPNCGVYAWRFTDNTKLIDPTDMWGDIQNECMGGSSDLPLSDFWHGVVLGFWSKSTLLARVNEPPPGCDCNVFSKEDLETREVMFILSKDVKEYEELYMDYGLTYDRSSYAPSEKDPTTLY